MVSTAVFEIINPMSQYDVGKTGVSFAKFTVIVKGSPPAHCFPVGPAGPQEVLHLLRQMKKANEPFGITHSSPRCPLGLVFPKDTS